MDVEASKRMAANVIQIQPPTPINDRLFRTIVGTRFTTFKNTDEIELPDGNVYRVTNVLVESCSVLWQLKFNVEHWGIKSIGVKPSIVEVRTVVTYELNGEKTVDVNFAFTPDTTNFEIDTNEFNPLANGIAPNGVEITIKNDDPANVKIKF